MTLWYLTDLSDREQEGSGLLVKNIYLGATGGERKQAVPAAPVTDLVLAWPERSSFIASRAGVQTQGFGLSEDIVKQRKDRGVE